jgi:hypothetical protein
MALRIDPTPEGRTPREFDVESIRAPGQAGDARIVTKIIRAILFLRCAAVAL